MPWFPSLDEEGQTRSAAGVVLKCGRQARMAIALQGELFSRDSALFSQDNNQIRPSGFHFAPSSIMM
ncbi:MAG TPA: hypothetical protein VMO17_02345 [Terriglobia bacterium]|nr:hypothetical protein [Terriglobia bacterium]